MRSPQITGGHPAGCGGESRLVCRTRRHRAAPFALRDPLGYFDSLATLLRSIQDYPGPVIAIVQGGAWGGAFNLVMVCDIVIADESAFFAITPARLGLPFNASGILQFMNGMGVNVAKEMFFTADPITAERTKNIGILNHLVPSDKILEFTIELAGRIASRSTLAIAIIKEQFRILSEASPIAPTAFERIQGLRRRVYDSHDYEEGVRAFLEKRPRSLQENDETASDRQHFQLTPLAFSR